MRPTRIRVFIMLKRLLFVGMLFGLCPFFLHAQEQEYEIRLNGRNGRVSFTMVYVEGGSFMMGCMGKKDECEEDQLPVHRVTLDGYYICETEVTQELWKTVMGNNNPSYDKGDKLPVTNMSWYDIQVFINKLNLGTGRTFRLPTEAEWEYAARGGKKSRGYRCSGDDDVNMVAWYRGNTSSLQPVKTKKPNELGLYDMSGNAAEWCSDWYGDYGRRSQKNPQGPSRGDDESKVVRGGSILDDMWDCSVSARNDADIDLGEEFTGFRLVLCL